MLILDKLRAVNTLITGPQDRGTTTTRRRTTDRNSTAKDAVAFPTDTLRLTRSSAVANFFSARFHFTCRQRQQQRQRLVSVNTVLFHKMFYTALNKLPKLLNLIRYTES